MMDKCSSFESERLSYRGICTDDTDCLVKWRSNPDLIKYFRNPKPITLISHLDWFSNSYLINNSRFDFIIIEKDSGEKIGTVGSNEIDYGNSICQTSHMIAERDFWGMGLSEEAVTALIRKMNTEGIYNFYCEIHQDNLASIHIYEKLGYSYFSQRGNFLTYRKTEV